MKVKTTGEFKRLGVSLGETGIIEDEGKVLEISEARFNQLGYANGNCFNTIFVVPVKEEKQVEIAKKEDKKETAKPKTRKKAK